MCYLVCWWCQVGFVIDDLQFVKFYGFYCSGGSVDVFGLGRID